MLIKKVRHQLIMTSYNDGIIEVYKSREKKTIFSAKLNETLLDDLEFIQKFYFKEESKRQEDLMFANSFGKTLSLKIKMPYTNKVEISHKVLYENYLYDIFHIDFSKNKKELYIYLERVRKIGI